MIERTRRLLGHTLVRNAALMYLVQFTSYLFPLITLPYLARVLSPEKFGLVVFAQTFIWYFLTLTEYGFNLTATRAIAVARDSPAQINRIFSSVMTAKFLLTVIGFAALCITTLATPLLRPNFTLFVVVFLTVVANFLFPLWLFQGMEQMRHVALRDFASKILSLLVLVALVHSDEDYLWAAAAQSGGMLLSSILGLWNVRKLGVRFQWPERDEIREQLRAGWPAFLTLAISAGAAVTNTFLLGLWAPVSEVAYYSAAQRIIAAARALASPVATAVYPHTAKKALNSEGEVLEFVHKYQWLFVGPFLAGGIVLLLGAPWIVPLFLGEKYRASVPVLQIMALGPALFSAGLVYSTYFMLACKYDKEWMRYVLISVAVNFAVFLTGFKFLPGPIALAVAWLAADATAVSLQARFYYRHWRAHTARTHVAAEAQAGLTSNQPQ